VLLRVIPLASEVRRGKNMKVLIIEDDQQVVNNIAFCLAVRYPEVVTVSSPRW
jgi:hypothetical protein